MAGIERVRAERRKLQPRAEREREREVIRCPIWIQSHLGPDKNRGWVMGHRHTSPSSSKVLGVGVLCGSMFLHDADPQKS